MNVSSVDRRSQIPATDDERNEPLVTQAQAKKAFANVDKAFETDLAAFVESRAVKKPTDDGILYVGFNKEAMHSEALALGSSGGRVRSVTGETRGGELSVNGTRYFLADPADARAFVNTLALDPRCAADVERAILSASSPTAKGKVAQLAMVFADAEHGKAIPSRLVLSGHSNGAEIFGSQGYCSFEDIQRLARAMPNAARQIEDVHFAACSTSGHAGVDSERTAWRAAFPNMKTMWGYTGTSPLAPTHHLAAWAAATKGRKDTLQPPPGLRGQHIATWSAKTGYKDEVSLPTLRRAQVEADDNFPRLFSGHNTSSSTALHDYETYRVLSGRNEISADERAGFAAKAEQLLRVRYYDGGVREEFAKRYASEVSTAYRAAGLEVPRFDVLPRWQALKEIAKLEEKGPLPPALRGLRDLDPSVIPTTDCRH